MRFLADENFPGASVAMLRAAGHDVMWVRTEAPGLADRDVLERSQDQNRVLFTFDKDFGELAWRFGLPASSGIVLFRLPGLTSADSAVVISSTLNARDDWHGHFSVVEAERIRIRKLPATR